MTVDTMLESMPATEILDWRAYFKIEAEEDSDRKAQQKMLGNLKGRRGRK